MYKRIQMAWVSLCRREETSSSRTLMEVSTGMRLSVNHHSYRTKRARESKKGAKRLEEGIHMSELFFLKDR